jgi:hypothetical protein
MKKRKVLKFWTEEGLLSSFYLSEEQGHLQSPGLWKYKKDCPYYKPVKIVLTIAEVS